MTQEIESPSPRVVRRAAALVVGDELLSGKIRDENTFVLSGTLRALGIELSRVIICPDDRNIIAHDLRQLSADFDVVFTSGGVGPTHDDLTIEGISDALGVATIVDQVLVELISSHYGENTTSTHLLMARVPEGSKLVTTADMRWPTVVARNVWILPGVPELFRMKLAIVRAHLRGPAPFFSQELLVRVEETEIKELLDKIVGAHSNVSVGSYPKYFDSNYKTRITFDGREAVQVDAAACHAKRLLGANLVSQD